MNILITGATGLVGSHLVEYLQHNSTHTLLLPPVEEMDISSSQVVDSYFATHKPDIVVHFAAYTDVTGAEAQRGDENGLVWNINVNGTETIVKACQKNNSYLIHISTDMVFSGREDDKGPYKEDHPIETDPAHCSWYGWTKVQAENKVKPYKNTTIVRISNPTRAHYDLKLDHVHKILAAYDAGKTLRMFNDQFLTLTYVNTVTEVIAKLISQFRISIRQLADEFRTIHVSSTNLYTPFDLAAYLVEKLRHVANVVQPSSLTEYLNTNPGRYLQYAGLDTTLTQQQLSLTFPTWQEIIDKEIEEGMK